MRTAAAEGGSRFDHATRELDPPFALADLAAFRDNAADLARRASGKPIRLVTKSLRCVGLIRRALDTPGFRGLMCYSLAEALWLFRQGISDDLLVAYPTADRSALRDLATDPGASEAITVTVDCEPHLDFIDKLRSAGTCPIRVCLELDAAWRPLGGVHIGARRSPVHSVSQAHDMASAIIDREGFRLVGIMAYEGQIAGLADAPAGRPLRGAALRWIQRRSIAEIAQRRAETVSAVRALTPLEFVNGGGTGSIEHTAAEPAVTEIAAGSGLIGPTLFDGYRGFRPAPAVFFALPVVRRPATNIVTLFGGGYIASGAPGKDREPRPYRPGGFRLTALEGAGEVQTPVVGSPADSLDLGDRVWFRHAKAGELAERFSHYHLVDGGEIVETVPTYRGHGTSFG